MASEWFLNNLWFGLVVIFGVALARGLVHKGTDHRNSEAEVEAGRIESGCVILFLLILLGALLVGLGSTTDPVVSLEPVIK